MVRVLDLGSNSFIVLVLDGEKVLFEKVYEVGLKAFMNDRMKALKIAKEILSKALNESDFRCPTYVFGTSVFRDDPEFFKTLVGEFNLKSHVLTEEEEAMYSYMSVDPELRMNITVADLGGGSLEIVRKDSFRSLRLGTHVLNSLFNLAIPGAKDFEMAVNYVTNQLSENLGEVVGIGGSFVAIAALKKGVWDLAKLDKERLNQKDISSVVREVRQMSFEQIRKKNILPDGREKTLVAGLAVALAIAQLSETLIVSTKGYRYTVAIMLEKNGELFQPWRARGDLNSRPPDPQSGALSS